MTTQPTDTAAAENLQAKIGGMCLVCSARPGIWTNCVNDGRCPRKRKANGFSREFIDTVASAFKEANRLYEENDQLKSQLTAANERADRAEDALAMMLDNFGGYVCPAVDAGISAMQAAGKDRWSMDAQMRAEKES